MLTSVVEIAGCTTAPPYGADNNVNRVKYPTLASICLTESHTALLIRDGISINRFFDEVVGYEMKHVRHTDHIFHQRRGVRYCGALHYRKTQQ